MWKAGLGPQGSNLLRYDCGESWGIVVDLGLLIALTTLVGPAGTMQVTSGSQGWSLGHSTLVSLRCLALLVVSAGGEVASSYLKSQRGNATAFKIRRKMFVAEQNLRPLRVLWEGPIAAFHIYFCTFFACAEAADGPRSARSWRGSRCPSLLSRAVTGHCCIGGS